MFERAYTNHQSMYVQLGGCMLDASIDKLAGIGIYSNTNSAGIWG